MCERGERVRETPHEQIMKIFIRLKRMNIHKFTSERGKEQV